MSELDDAVQEYITARKAAAAEYERLLTEDPSIAFATWQRIENAAWDKFYPIKVKHWNLDHPD